MRSVSVTFSFSYRNDKLTTKNSLREKVALPLLKSMINNKRFYNPLYTVPVHNYHFSNISQITLFMYTVPMVIDFPRYNMKWSWEDVILCRIFHVVSGFPLHLMLYRGNLDCFSNSVRVHTYLCCIKRKKI